MTFPRPKATWVRCGAKRTHSTLGIARSRRFCLGSGGAVCIKTTGSSTDAAIRGTTATPTRPEAASEVLRSAAYRVGWAISSRKAGFGNEQTRGSRLRRLNARIDRFLRLNSSSWNPLTRYSNPPDADAFPRGNRAEEHGTATHRSISTVSPSCHARCLESQLRARGFERWVSRESLGVPRGRIDSPRPRCHPRVRLIARSPAR